MSSDWIRVDHIHRDLLTYEDAWRVQQQLHQDVCAGRRDAAVLSLQHPATLTLGKHASSNHLLVSEKELRQEGIELLRVDRGGEVTAHQPGQITIYPILPISRLRLSPRKYIDHLCGAVINLLREFGVQGHLDEEFPGVWVGSSKICAVGVRIRSRVSMHGLALNVSNDLSLFNKIVPCGIQNRGVTSLREITGKEAFDLQQIAQRFVCLLVEAVGGMEYRTGDELLAKNLGSSYYQSESAMS